MSAAPQAQQAQERGLPQATLRVGTLNVNGLACKLSQVVDFANRHAIDILCLQETHLSAVTAPSAVAAARKAGWKLLVGSPAVDSTGRGTAGVAVLTQWPVAVGFISDGDQAGRWMTVFVHRPRFRPFEVVNLYLPASDKGQAQAMANQILQDAAARGTARFVIGDWNLTPWEEPVQTTHRCGALHLADDLLGPELVNTTTRTNHAGRHIDFALCSTELAPISRGQVVTGISDHDLVWYDLELSAHLEPALHVAPKRKLQATQPVSQDTWEGLFPAESFAKHLSDQDVEQAWRVLSSAAESALQPKQGPARHWVGQPVQTGHQTEKAEVLQSVRERRLRRLHRRLEENLRQPTQALSTKIWRTWQEVRDWYPELSGLSFSERSDLSSVATCIEKERVAAQQGRIQQWKQRLDNSEAAAIDWVKRDLVDEPFEMGTPIHPQLKVSHVQSKWREVWNPPQMPAVADILPFQQHLNPGRQCDAVSFTAGALRRVVERGRHKAAGPDGWKPAHWALLPEGFFTAFASLWQVVYNTSVMPQAWLQIRCVLVPKGEAGGYRPISVASLAWRIGLTVVMQQLHPWLEAWLPSELCGGLRGKSTDDAHSTLHDDIVNALNNRSSVFGVKLDVSKCFDTVVPGQALHIWQRQGAPLAVVRLLGVFYSDSNRRFEYHGAVAAEAFSCKRGLLQGCPASCGLLAGIMALWRGYICHQAPSIRCSVYVDDRTVWTDTSCEVVASALEATAEVDEACGFRLNLSKCEGFATGVAKQRTLRRTLQERQLDWPVSGRFKLLGVVYNLTRRRRTPLNEKAAAKVLKRLTRVKLLSLDWHKKRRIIRAAVLSLFSFVGAWHTVSKAVLGKWRRQIELSVMKPVKGRSRFLLWAGLLGPELDPEFQLDFAVFRHELWRLRKGLPARPRLSRPVRRRPNPQQPVQPALRLRVFEPDRLVEVLNKWGWTRVDGSCFQTPLGVLDLAWDGMATIKAAARFGWERALWQTEPRACDDNCKLKYNSHHPCFAEHKVWLRSQRAAHRHSLRTALAAGIDGHIATGATGSVVTCTCGEATPSRQHITWRCPQQQHASVLRYPADDAELRLLIPCVKHPSDCFERNLLHDAGRVATLLTQAFAQTQAQVTVATDGSCIGKVHALRRAAWSVVVQGCDPVADALPGLDQSAPAAEFYAAAIACKAAADTGVPVHIVSDCLAVTKLAHRARLGHRPPPTRTALWPLLGSTTLSWVPSHGKQPHWQHGVLDTASVRKLNELADKAALSACQRRLASPAFSTWLRATKEAEAWERAALHRQYHACEALRATLPNRPERE